MLQTVDLCVPRFKREIPHNQEEESVFATGSRTHHSICNFTKVHRKMAMHSKSKRDALGKTWREDLRLQSWAWERFFPGQGNELFRENLSHSRLVSLVVRLTLRFGPFLLLMRRIGV